MVLEFIADREIPLNKLREVLFLSRHADCEYHFIHARHQRKLPPSPPPQFIPQTQGSCRFTLYIEGHFPVYLGDRGALIRRELHPGSVLVMEPFCYNAMDPSQAGKAFFSVLRNNFIDIAWMEVTEENSIIRRHRLHYSDPALPLFYRAFCTMKQYPDKEELTRHIFVNLLSMIALAMEEEEEKISRPRTIYQRMQEYVEEHFERDLSRGDLARHFSVSPGYVSTIFKRYSGRTFNQTLVELRLEKAQQLLLNTDYTLDYIASQCGFHFVPYFIEVFRKFHTLSPGEFRTGRSCGNMPD